MEDLYLCVCSVHFIAFEMVGSRVSFSERDLHFEINKFRSVLYSNSAARLRNRFEKHPKHENNRTWFCPNNRRTTNEPNIRI